MGPVSSRMGEIFEFAVVGDGVDPMELRSVADWTIRYRLLGVEGVSFVENLGGFRSPFPNRVTATHAFLREKRRPLKASDCSSEGLLNMCRSAIMGVHVVQIRNLIPQAERQRSDHIGFYRNNLRQYIPWGPSPASPSG